jgi:hypothetical protein
MQRATGGTQGENEGMQEISEKIRLANKVMQEITKVKRESTKMIQGTNERIPETTETIQGQLKGCKNNERDAMNN